MAAAADLKSADFGHAGSSPASRTTFLFSGGKMESLVSKTTIAIIGLALWLKPVTQVTANYVEPSFTKPIVTMYQSPIEKRVQEKDIHCLAVMVYGEARGENFYGKAGVAWVAYNRYQNTYSENMCDIVTETKQFQALNNYIYYNAAITEVVPTKPESLEWIESKKVAELVYNEVIPDPTKGSTHFVNPNKLVRKPNWLKKLTKKMVIENHTFYK